MPSSMTPGGVALVATGALIAVIALAGVISSRTESQPHLQIAAESIVTLKKDAFACASKIELEEAFEHIRLDERTKLQAMIDSKRCSTLDTPLKFRVLHLEGKYMEFAREGAGHTDGAWTLVELAIP